MLIKSIGPVRTVNNRELIQVSNFGKYKDWYLNVDEFKDNSGKIIEKRFVIWNDLVQYIINKKRNEKKGFDRYW